MTAQPPVAYFASGTGLAFVGGSSWVLVGAGGRAVDVEGLWAAVSADRDAADILAVLTGGTVATAPDFALVRWEPTRIRTIVRGALRVSVADVEVSGEDATTWVERTLPITSDVSIDDGTRAATESYRVVAGVVPASRLSGPPSSSTPLEEPQHGDAKPAGEQGDPAPETPQAMSFDALLVARQDQTPTDDTILPGPHDTQWAESTLAAVEDSDFEDAAGTAPKPAPPVPEPIEVEERDDTVARPTASLGADGPLVGGAPMVHARACPVGHLNAPHAHLCRVCREPITSEAVIQARRPSMGVLALSDGRQFSLDRNIVIGRAPAATSRGSQVPGLVPVDGEDVSRSHVEVRMEDWSVLVVDLGSANGTMVALPERPPVRLRAHEPMLIVPGTTITLADSIEVRFEPR